MYNPRMRPAHLSAAVFFAGMTTLATELAASRLLENYFGASNLTYAVIIGLILIYLTLGYYLGGRVADRQPETSLFLAILAWGAFTTALIPLIARPILRVAAQAFDTLEMGALIGAFFAAMLLFIIPITLLGMVSPFAVRLAIRDQATAGRVAGRLYALSTLGSFLGTFLPGLLLIPLVGTFRAFIVIGGSLLILALILRGLGSGWRSVAPWLWMPAIVILLGVLGVRGFDKTSAGLIYETESAYNYIQVIQDGDYRYLRLNDGQGEHSIYHPIQLFYGGPWEQVLAAPFWNTPPVRPGDIRSAAIVGLAAGTTARQLSRVYPQIEIDGYEIDGRIVDVGRDYFGMDIPNLHVYVSDGRYGLAHSPRIYQIISLDAYRPPYIPWHLTTVDFFREVRRHLTADGVVTVNVGRAPDDRRMIEALTATLGEVFPSVHVMDLPDTFNSILYATVQPTDQGNLEANLIALLQDPETDPLLLQPLTVLRANLQPQPAAGPVFTDDQAQVEWITNNMVLRFLVSGGGERMPQ